MADDDEIDVLGDFSLDNLLSKNENGITSCYENPVSSNNSELLNSDYSLNTSWLIDHGVGNDIWYSNSNNDYSSEVSPANTSLGFDEVICAENKPLEESIWTNEEKNSLDRGLEIYGKHCLRLSQYIGTKTSSQVKYYLNNVYVAKNSPIFNIDLPDNVTNTNLVHEDNNLVYNMSDLIEDAQIPASIEEVIAVVSTAKPTVQNVQSKSNKSNSDKYHKIPSQKSGIRAKLNNISRKNKVGTHHLLDSFKKKRMKKVESKPKIQKEYTIDEELRKSELKQLQATKKDVVPVSSGEELIKISKEDNSDLDSDIEIDIDEEKPSSVNTKTEKPEVNIKQEYIKESLSESSDDAKLPEDNKDITKNMDEHVHQYLSSMTVPDSECIMKENDISDVEKFVHSEFFEGRSVRTPSRYLKIRNYIIDYWTANKPTYCTKTSVRIGLKNCGDVNCIGRIHQYLEQIGAINFGCPQVQYIRPLLNILSTNVNSIHLKEKSKSDKSNIVLQRSDVRARMKKKYNNDGEGGYTMIHNENGEIIDTNVVNEEKQNKPRNYRKNIKLVYCKSFTTDQPAPYSVKLSIEALLMLDLHSHSALIEVMGLLGGTYDMDRKELLITRYIPCRSTDHSNTHCDMCPVSQSEASETIQSEGLEVIGWFHSHPTFYPNPSLQDIDTQLSMQEYLSNVYSPFVGVILSPFRTFTNTLMSEYRCLIVDKNQENKDGVGVPYKFLTDLYSDNFNIKRTLKHAEYIFSMKSNIPSEFVIDFNKPYFQDNTITYMDKFLASIKTHLARCTNINKMTCDAIIAGLRSICLSNSVKQQESTVLI